MDQIADFELRLKCLKALRWIAGTRRLSPQVEDSLCQTFACLHNIMSEFPEPVFSDNMWPEELGLDLLIVPRCASRHAILINRPTDEITESALLIVGAAIRKRLHQTGDDLMVYEMDNGTEVLVFAKESRPTMLLATGIELPEEMMG